MALTKRAQAVFLIEAIAKRPVLQLNNEIRLKEVNVSPDMRLKNLLTPNEISYVFQRVSGYEISNTELMLARNGNINLFITMILNKNVAQDSQPRVKINREYEIKRFNTLQRDATELAKQINGIYESLHNFELIRDK